MDLKGFRKGIAQIRAQIHDSPTFAHKLKVAGWGIKDIGKNIAKDTGARYGEYKGLRSMEGKKGYGVFDAALKTYGTRGAFLLAGTGIGLATSDEDHRLKGVALGAAGGLAASGLSRVYFMQRGLKQSAGGKALLYTGLATVAATASVAAGYMSSRFQPEASAHYNGQGDGGYFMAAGAGPDDAVYQGSSVSERQSALQIGGDIVLGAHHMRHG